MELKKINDIQIKLPKINKIDTDLIKGKEYFINPYNNIFISAYKCSGKSTVIFNLLKLINNDTKVYFFVPTFEKDATYKIMQSYLDKKLIEYHVYDTLEGNLSPIINELLKPPPEQQEEKDKEELFQVINYVIPEEDDLTESEDKEKVIKVRKSKYIAPQNLFIFDDISNELMSSDLTAFLKKNRHTKSRVIISSQYILDLSPQSRAQIDSFLLFPGIDSKRLQNLYNNIDSSYSYNDFEKMYITATNKKYNFLYYDKGTNDYRVNFDKRFEKIN
jgi:hypothetical protein